jgi:aminoglycoside phosphotransferase family enzyme/predicted kinase
MVVEDQSEVIDFLGSSRAHGGARVERIDTHTAVVFLAGSRAYKLKRAVRFDYVDFSTVERRRQSCHAEVQLNRRTAPLLYTGVLPVTRQPNGALELGGRGESIEWLVEMRRFDQSQLLDALAAAHNLHIDMMRALGTAIATFHAEADQRRDHGGRTGMAWVVEGNAAGFAELGRDGLDPELSARVTALTRAELECCGFMLDTRREAGFVRRCHGDLHLRNIVLLDGSPTLFDGIEFNDEISCIDVLYDLSFLLMDLWHRRLAHHANVVLNRYMACARDLGGLRLLPLFLSCRAAVRAKTSATAAQVQIDLTRRSDMQSMAAEYLAMAADFLQPRPLQLVAIGGLSGSGKTTMATRLAPGVGAVPGAIVLRSDEIRKELCGVPPLERLGPEGYLPAMSERVYDTLMERARTVVRAGHSVIVDAVWPKSSQRDAIERVAREESVGFSSCWLSAPEAVRVERVDRRRADASDATAEVVREQGRQGTDPASWPVVETAGDLNAVLHRCARLVLPGVSLVQGSGDMRRR